MPLVRQLHKAGSGCVVRIPKPVLEQLDLAVHDRVEIAVVGRQLVLTKAAPAEGVETDGA